MVKQDIQELVTKMLSGDRASLARLISLIERQSPEAPGIMEQVSPYCHKAYRIGITGPAGSGKSTLIDKLTTFYRRNGLYVGIIAIDPSSTITGGAVLGDRIRLQQHYLDGGVFIRSMATRGCYGGICQAVKNVTRLMDASGKDVILIETTGAGQTEKEITRVADLVVTVLVPGFGDSIQLMKAGLIEIADIIVINKADREGSEILADEIRDELSCSSKETKPAIIIAEASHDIGITDLYNELEDRRKRGKSSIMR